MHEYSIARALIDKVEQEARQRSALAVARVQVRIGELSGVDPGLLQTAFELTRDRTACERAVLEVVRVPAAWCCRECSRDIPPGTSLKCPACGAPAALLAGDEILLERIEMEVA